jgi:hypothetical protein
MTDTHGQIGTYTFYTAKDWRSSTQNNPPEYHGMNTINVSGFTLAGTSTTGNTTINSKGGVGGTGEGSACSNKCSLASAIKSGAIQYALCVAQCTIIDWETSIITYVINKVLMPALGLGSK